MTETSSDHSPQTPKDGQGAASAASGAAASPSAKPTAPRGGAQRKSSSLLTAFIILLVIAAALAAALWAQRREFEASGQAFAGQISQLGRELAQARETGAQALALARAQTSQVADLQTRIREVQTQNSALQQAWQGFSSGATDEMLINDVERSVNLASQQLRLAGDVSNAIVALETAQSRLAQANRPSLASLQQSINGDLDRLRAVGTVDVPVQSKRIEDLIRLAGSAPMLVPDAAARAQTRQGQTQTARETAAPRSNCAITSTGCGEAQAQTPRETAVSSAPATPITPAAQAVASLPADASWWQRWRAEMATWPARAGATLAEEFGGLIRVQRVDRPEALLLSSEQAGMVRATLSQRLMTAQLALMMRQQPVWKTELDKVLDTLEHYYDTQAPDTRAAIDLARQLDQVQISVRLPDVSDSLNALAALRTAAAAKSGQDAASRNGRD